MEKYLKKWMLEKELNKFLKSKTYYNLVKYLQDFGYPDICITAFYGMNESRIKILLDNFVKSGEVEAFKAFLLYACKNK